MSMTRREFNIAAEQLSDWSDAPDGKLFTKDDVVYEFVKFLRQTNPNFDAPRFIKACREGERKRDALPGDGQ